MESINYQNKIAMKQPPKIEIPEMTKEQEDACIQFVLDKQNGFLPLNMTVQAIQLTLKCKVFPAMEVFKFLNK